MRWTESYQDDDDDDDNVDDSDYYDYYKIDDHCDYDDNNYIR